MAADSRNPGEPSPDTGLITVSCRIPRWLYVEIGAIAERRLSDRSTMFREALLAWLPGQRNAEAAQQGEDTAA